MSHRITDCKGAAIPDKVRWDVIDPEFLYYARDKDGAAYVFDAPPEKLSDIWRVVGEGDACRVNETGLKIVVVGNMPWDQSLIKRP